jgi:hypothetical protein
MKVLFHSGSLAGAGVLWTANVSDVSTVTLSVAEPGNGSTLLAEVSQDNSTWAVFEDGIDITGGQSIPLGNSSFIGRGKYFFQLPVGTAYIRFSVSTYVSDTVTVHVDTGSGVPYKYTNEIVAPYSDGTDDSTKLLQRLANTGKVVRLAPFATYNISRSILFKRGGGGFVGDKTSTIYMKASAFNNTSLSGKYLPNSCGIFAYGQQLTPFNPLVGFTLRGFTIQSEVADGRLVDAICVRNVKNCVIEDMEIFGFPVGVGIRASTLSGRSILRANHIHDFYTNAVWPSLPQSTGIELDGDRVNTTNSYEVLIADNRVINLLQGPVPVLAWGYQTDGINVQGSGTGTGAISRHIVRNNTVDGVGEGIDNFSSSTIISENHLINCYAGGLKIIHGASNCLVIGNIIDKAGLFAIGISEGNGQDTVNNQIIGNRVSNIDPDFVWGPGGSNTIHSSPINTAAIGVYDGVGGNTVKHTLIADNYVDPGPNCNYNYAVPPSSVDTIIRNNRDVGVGNLGYINGSAFATTAGTGLIMPAIPTLFKATIAAATLTNSDGVKKIPFDTVLIDSRGEYDSGNVRWKSQIPGMYMVKAVFRFALVASTFEFKPNINVNGTIVATRHLQISQTGEASFVIEAVVPIGFGQYVEISASLTDTGARTITAGSQWTTLTIQQIQ